MTGMMRRSPRRRFVSHGPCPVKKIAIDSRDNVRNESARNLTCIMRILICRLALEISKIKVAHQIAQKYIRISNGSWTGWFRNLRLYSPSAIWIHNPVRSRIINSHGITARHLRDRENYLRNPASGRNNQGYHSEKPLSLHHYPCMHSCRGTYVMKRAMRYIKVLRRR